MTRIESKPVFHYRPGAEVLSLGGLSCNLFCRFCQNYEIAFRDAHDAAGLHEPNLPPAAAVALAVDRRCVGLGWSHNEPTISPTFLLESAREARAAGLFTVLATNGLLTDAAVSVLGPWIDVYRVDVKSLDPTFYRSVASASRISDTIGLAARMRYEFGAHVEVVTNVMPGFNDSDHSLTHIASSIVERLGTDTPWHLTAFVPYALMQDVPPTPASSLTRARHIGHQQGLRFVYVDHPLVPGGLDTCCSSCGAIVISRSTTRTTIRALGVDGECMACGEQLGVRTSVGRAG